MALSFDSNNNGMIMPVAPMSGNYSNGGFGSGWGGDGFFWLLIIFVIAFMGNGFGFGGWGGNGAGGGVVNTVNNDLQRGFDQQAVMGGLNGITAGINGLSQQMCTGNAGIVSAINSGFASAESNAAARQIADLQQQFAAQTAMTTGMTGLQSQLATCCCNQAANTADLKYTIATEACSDRAAVTQALQEVTAQNNANTQRILDQMCQDRYDNLLTKYNDLQRQATISAITAGQAEMKGQIIADNAAQTAALLQNLNPAPVPAYPVQNPNGCNCGTNRFCG